MRQGDFRRFSRRLDGFAPGRLVVVAVVQGPGNPPVRQPKAGLSGCPSSLVQRSRGEAGGSSSANPGLPAPLPSVASPNLASVPALALIAVVGAVGKGSGCWVIGRGGWWPAVVGCFGVAPPPSASAGPVLRTGQVRQPETLYERQSKIRERPSLAALGQVFSQT